MATPVGRSNVSGPFPDTPGLPSVISTSAVGGELQHLLTHHHADRVPGRHAKYHLGVVDVGRPCVPFLIDGESVRIGEKPGAKAFQQPAGGIELQNRRVGWPTIDADRAAGRNGVETAMEDPDVAVARDMHSNDLSPAATVHALRDGRPPLHQPIRIGKGGRFGYWVWAFAVNPNATMTAALVRKGMPLGVHATFGPPLDRNDGFRWIGISALNSILVFLPMQRARGTPSG